jgi:hypothetical protein
MTSLLTHFFYECSYLYTNMVKEVQTNKQYTHALQLGEATNDGVTAKTHDKTNARRF